MVEMNKTYKTRNGMPVRILCNDLRNSTYTVIAAVYDQETGCESTISLSSTGAYIEDEEHDFDIIEVTPYDDFKVDDLCVVWEVENSKEFRYFSHEKENLAWCFGSGGTSYTRAATTSWTNCRKPTEEEIKTKTIKD